MKSKDTENFKRVKKTTLANVNTLEEVSNFIDFLEQNFDAMLAHYNNSNKNAPQEKNSPSLDFLFNIFPVKNKNESQRTKYRSLIATLNHYTQKSTQSGAKKFANDFLNFYNRPLTQDAKISLQSYKEQCLELDSKKNANSLITQESLITNEQESVSSPPVIKTPTQIISEEKPNVPSTQELSQAITEGEKADFSTRNESQEVHPVPSIDSSQNYLGSSPKDNIQSTISAPQELKSSSTESKSPTKTNKSQGQADYHPKIDQNKQTASKPKNTVKDRLAPLIKRIEKEIKNLRDAGSKDFFSFGMGKKANNIQWALNDSISKIENLNYNLSDKELFNQFLEINKPNNLRTALNYHRLFAWGGKPLVGEHSSTKTLQNIENWIRTYQEKDNTLTSQPL